MTLDPHSLRVLGALIEKEIATPESYPLSLNALIAACNQRSSREPVMDLTEDEVRQSLHTLADLELVTATRDSRVAKYEHRARTVLNLRRDETALLCLLLLRGPQTPGELRARSERMFQFDDLGAVVSALDRLASRPQPVAGATAFGAGPLAVLLPRAPGAREARYAHLLGGPPTLPPGGPRDQARPSDPSRDGVREEIERLSHRLDELGRRLDRLEARQPDPTGEAPAQS